MNSVTESYWQRRNHMKKISDKQPQGQKNGLTLKQTNLSMKRTLLLLSVVIATLFISCGKQESSGCQPKTPASEKADMVAYCTANGINYTEHPSGILYEIILMGNDPAPTSTSLVSTVYTGKLLNGFQFDATANPRDFSLAGGLIEGWKIAIPLIKKGGRIKIVIPSALGYTCVGSSNGAIPPNSPLFFDITLTDVK